MRKGQIIGVDIGTSRCRAVLYESTGRMVEEASRSYPILTPSPGRQEQDPDIVLNAFLEALQEALARADKGNLLGIGLGSYFHSLICVDRNGRPLTRCIIWPDMRGREAARLIAEACDPYRLYRRTGCPIHPMYPICRARWLKERDPTTFRRTHKVISMKGYIVHEICGEYLADWSVASGTGILNIHRMQWDDEAVALAGLDPTQLPSLVSPFTRLPPLRRKYSEMLGLDEEIPIIIGGADGTLSNLGVGAVGPREADNTLGTGGAVRVLLPEPRLDVQMRSWCYVATPDRWAVGGKTASGLVYEWFIREFADQERREAERRGVGLYELLDEYAASIAPGSDRLLFLPFIVGARSPLWNPDARGVLFGLSYDHTKRHIVRAFMEGVTYQRYGAFRAVEEVIGGIDSIRVSGGFVSSPTWVQITADVYGRELLVPEVPQNTAWGAAAMVMLALGLIGRLEDVRSMVRIRQVIRPNSVAHDRYREIYEKYERLYRKIEDEFVLETEA